MLSLTGVLRAKGLASLRRSLHRLRQSNRVAESCLQERRRLHRLIQEEQNNADRGDATTSTASTHREALKLLPRNEALEAAIALSISEHRDARTELELMRRLVNSTLLSLASPVDRRWDPYDVKPQVFALDTYIALPVFTSVDYLRLFCERFGFTVRDPSGILWAGGSRASTAHKEVRIAGLLPDAVVQSEWWQRRNPPLSRQEEIITRQEDGDAAKRSGEEDDATGYRSSVATSHEFAPSPVRADDAVPSPSPRLLSEDPSVDADDLFRAMAMNDAPASTEGQVAETPRRKRKLSRCPRHRSGRASKASVAAHQGGASQRASRQRQRQRQTATSASANPEQRKSRTTDASVEDAKRAYGESLAHIAPFQIRQATPLPTFGPFIHPFLIGYFAEVSTLLHNAAIVPEKVDIVLNPASPLEFVLSRAATDRVLQKEQLLHQAYLKVERELQREFSTFFAAYCPEVTSAFSACVPLPMKADEVDAARKAARRTSSGRSRCGATGKVSSNALQVYHEQTRLLREAEYCNGVAYELVLLIRSDNLAETFSKIQRAKHQTMLMGHADLDILPEMAAAPHVREAAQHFYSLSNDQATRSATQATSLDLESHKWSPHEVGSMRAAVFARKTASPTDSSASPVGSPARRTGSMGVYVRRGSSYTINVAQPAESYYHDPTNAYTEAHAVFTEDLKVARGQ